LKGFPLSPNGRAHFFLMVELIFLISKVEFSFLMEGLDFLIAGLTIPNGMIIFFLVLLDCRVDFFMVILPHNKA